VKSKSPQPIHVGERVADLRKYRKEGGVVVENDGATLYDMGDRIACLELHTKMNALDADVIAMFHKAADAAEKSFDGMVVGNHAPDAFSAGANAFLVLMAAQQGQWEQLGQMIKSLQDGLMRLKYAEVPTVTAPFGIALGGGAELTMHGAASRAHAELYMGQVEGGLGLIPAGGGCKELLARHLSDLPDDADPFVLIKKVFFMIAMGKVSTSAEEARQMGFLNPSDGVTLNRDHLLYDAKQTALGMARAGYRTPRRRSFRLPGKSGYATVRSQLQMMQAAHQISAHDVVVGSKLGYILTGGDVSPTVRVSEQHVLDLEREAFLSLCGEEKTRERIQYFLMNNKPLRN
jgi:3-hydroxyacyl-CoA dehydrogenase